ncbi:MAG: NTP transferase domain-containing protein [Bacteroidales bacterium]
MHNCIILAAGESERMGELKPFLMFDKELTFLEYLIMTYIDFGVETPLVVVNEKVLKRIRNEDNVFFRKCQLILNQYPVKGRFYSVALGLNECIKSSSVFIQNVDNPFIGSELLEKMADSLSGFDFVVPQYNGKTGHPVLISSKLAGQLLKRYHETSVLNDVLKSFKRHEIQVADPKVLANVNTPKEYQNYFGG